MNQTNQKVNNFSINHNKRWVKKHWWMFGFFQLTMVWGTLHYWMPLSLWFQSLLLALSLILSLSFLFYQFLKPYLKNPCITGYDPWHLQPIVQKYIPNTPVILYPHQTTFCMAFHFYAFKRVIFSSALLKSLNQKEIEQLAQCLCIYMKPKYNIYFTQISYLIFVIYLPIHLLMVLCNQLRLSFIHRYLSVFLHSILTPPFCLLTYWRYKKFDQECAETLGNPKHYSMLLWKLQTHWNVSDQTPASFLSSVFMTNPLTKDHSYFTIQPPAEKRIKALTGQFPI